MNRTSPLCARRLAAAITLASLLACTTAPPPTAELAEAEQAVRAAEASDAATLAPLQLQTAQSKLDEARAALAAGQHAQARRLAEQAVVDADFAEVTARTEQAAREAAALRIQVHGAGAPIIPRRAGS